MKCDETKIVASGEWKYGGINPCRIIIHTEDMRPGTGDYEDSPEIANDRNMSCVSVWYENPANKGTFNAGDEYYLTVEEAIKEVTNKIQEPVIWKIK